MHKASPLLIALLLLIPTIGADTPDHADDDGDFASGPVGIDGVSTESDGKRLRFDLHIESFDLEQPDTRYWFDLDAGSKILHWECLVRGIRDILTLSCDLVEPRSRPFAEYHRVGDRVHSKPLRELAEQQVVHVPAKHHLNLASSTIGFTSTYKDLGLDSGDTVTLHNGAAFYEDRPKRVDVPADAIVVEQDIAVQ